MTTPSKPDIIHTDPEDSTVPCGPIVEGPVPENGPPEDEPMMIPDPRMTTALGRRRHIAVVGEIGRGHTMRWGRKS